MCSCFWDILDETVNSRPICESYYSYKCGINYMCSLIVPFYKSFFSKILWKIGICPNTLIMIFFTTKIFNCTSGTLKWSKIIVVVLCIFSIHRHSIIHIMLTHVICPLTYKCMICLALHIQDNANELQNMLKILLSSNSCRSLGGGNGHLVCDVSRYKHLYTFGSGMNMKLNMKLLLWQFSFFNILTMQLHIWTAVISFLI
jgi:hypothetical protein